MTDLWSFAFVSLPAMITLGLRHALDVDHITASDNLVRLHNAAKRARWVGAGFSIGHMISVLAVMILIIFIFGSVTKVEVLSFWGGIIGVFALATILVLKLYSRKSGEKTDFVFLAVRSCSGQEC